jgi:hypothetical protein
VQVHLSPSQQCLERLAGRHRAELRSLSSVFQVAHISAFNDHQVG